MYQCTQIENHIFQTPLSIQIADEMLKVALSLAPLYFPTSWDVDVMARVR